MTASGNCSILLRIFRVENSIASKLPNFVLSWQRIVSNSALHPILRDTNLAILENWKFRSSEKPISLNLSNLDEPWQCYLSKKMTNCSSFVYCTFVLYAMRDYSVVSKCYRCWTTLQHPFNKYRTSTYPGLGEKQTQSISMMLLPLWR